MLCFYVFYVLLKKLSTVPLKGYGKRSFFYHLFLPSKKFILKAISKEKKHCNKLVASGKCSVGDRILRLVAIRQPTSSNLEPAFKELISFSIKKLCVWFQTRNLPLVFSKFLTCIENTLNQK